MVMYSQTHTIPFGVIAAKLKPGAIVRKFNRPVKMDHPVAQKVCLYSKTCLYLDHSTLPAGTLSRAVNCLPHRGKVAVSIIAVGYISHLSQFVIFTEAVKNTTGSMVLFLGWVLSSSNHSRITSLYGSITGQGLALDRLYLGISEL